LKYLALRVIVGVFGRLPPRVLYAVADVLGTLAWYALASVRATTRDHMAHVPRFVDDTDARDRAARGCARAAARYYADFARGAHLSPDQALDEIDTFEGLEQLFEGLERSCGVIMVSPHLGAPEYLIRAAGRIGLDMLVLTERLHPPRMNDFVHQVRQQPGVRFIEADLGGVRETLAHLRGGGIVAILADRDIQSKGREVAFFGERTRLPSGPVELALRTGAPIIPGVALRTRAGRYAVAMLQPLALQRRGDRETDVEAGMGLLARALEDCIERAPDQWFALQPIWRGLPARMSPRRPEAHSE
jgi:KDO2-lipid IV(A) lauroyltransferase